MTIDGKGKFRLIYRDSDETGDRFRIAACDFSDMGEYRVGEPVDLTLDGMPPGDLCASPVAYDPVRKVYYLMAEKEWDGVVRCCRETVVAVASADALERGEAEWTTLAVLDSGVTGRYGNHNPAVVRDPYGRIRHPDRLEMSLSSGEQSYIWSFRICGIVGELVEPSSAI
ncbi:hypothetical protein [Cohnella sp. 56]|uniref:hypothetical protein n=1 Tax=Cohnella sp. 56 TaxID=3113722 RepID=UPI0030E79753